jgi:MFS transporter, Spinster family, sphingosine-1-phosphate transporter
MWKSLTKNQRTILIVLCLLNFFNYLDRQVIFPMFGIIKKEFLLTDFQLGLLGTVFLLVHSLASVPLGIMADKYSRRAVIGFGVLFWSLASFGSGLAQSFKQLLFARSLVGVGEASYAPAATAMITDNFPQAVRGQAQGLFNVGVFAGGTIGAIIGGLIAYQFGDWRLAFFIVSIPGLLLAYASFKLPDVMIHHDEPHASVFSLFKNRAFLWIVVSGIFLSFSSGGLIAWGVEFVTRYKGYNVQETTLILGGTLIAGGILGVVLGSWLGDRIQKRLIWGRAIVIAISLIVGMPFFFTGLIDLPMRWMTFLFFFFGMVLTSFYHGPAIVVLHDVVPKRLRASAVAVYLLIVHLIGDTPAPALVGKISDMYNLRSGMELAMFAILLGGIAFLPVCYLIATKRVAVHVD